MARYIRFQPTEWQGYISMRVELYGCYAGNVFFLYAVPALITPQSQCFRHGWWQDKKTAMNTEYNLLFNTGEH